MTFSKIRLSAFAFTAVLGPAIALAGCQTRQSPTQPILLSSAKGAVTSEAAAPLVAVSHAQPGTVVVTLGASPAGAAKRSLLGLGFASTNIQAARIRVLGADMVTDSKTVPWNGTAALNVTLSVPAGYNRVFVLEALNAVPDAQNPEPPVLSTIRGVANVVAGTQTNVALNYNADAVGRVLSGLMDGLGHGFGAEFGTLTDARRTELLAALTGATLLGKLQAYVTQVTQFNEANNTFAGIHPLYFHVDHALRLLLKNGTALLDAAPTLPLEAFRASGTLTVKALQTAAYLGNADALRMELLLPVPVQEAMPLVTPDGVQFRFKDVPPGTWGMVIKADGQPIGAGLANVTHGENQGTVTVGPYTPPTPVPTPTPTPVPTPTLVPTPTPTPSLTRVVVNGSVYDEVGALVDEATVTVKSLDAAFPYERSVTVLSGAYVVNDVPEGILLEFTATRLNWTKRSQVQSFQALAGITNTVNFSGAYFISRFPEIVSTTPVDDAIGVDASTVSYKLTLSEALDATNRRRFENAIRLTNIAGDASFEIRKGSTFLTDAETKAAVTWNGAGTEATLAFNAPLLASSTDAAEYKVFLSTWETIEDPDGNDLDVNRPFLEKGLAGANYGETHDSIATFKIAKDNVAPTLTGVSVSVLSSTTRIELTFSEPMAAYSTFAAGISSATLPNLANYTFMVGAQVGDLQSLALDANASAMANQKNAGITLTKFDAKSEFRLADGEAIVSIDSKDAKRVFLTVNSTSFFGADLAEIKARVAGVADPAGNLIGSNDADINLVTGSL